MKKYVLGTLLFSTIAISGIQNTVEAETTQDKATTEGKVIFEAGEVTKPIDPETEEPIIPPVPPIGTKDVWLIHAPKFDFGKVKISTEEQNHPVLESKFTEEKTNNEYYRADFLQVSDISGNDKLTWDVKVKQEAAFATDEGDKLDNTRIRLYGQTLKNNLKEIGTDISGFTLGANGYTDIPVGDEITMLSSNTAGFTNGTFTSNVLSSDKADVQNTTQGYNESVKLNIPKGENPKKDKDYKANLIWSLTVAP